MTKKGNVCPSRPLNDALTLSFFTGTREMCSGSGSTRSVGCQKHPEPQKGQRPPGYFEFLLWAAQGLLPGASEQLWQSICHSLAGRKQTCDTFLAWHQCHLCYSLLENSSSFVPHFSEMKDSWEINCSSSCSEGKRREVSIFRIYCILKSSDTQDIPSSLLIK